MSVAGIEVGGNKPVLQAKSNSVTQNKKEDVSGVNKKDNSKLVYGSLAGLAVLSLAGVALAKAKKGKSQIETVTSQEIEEIADAVAKSFDCYKRGLAYDVSGNLFNGTRELVGWKNRKFVTTYQNGKIIERNYYPAKRNDIERVCKTYAPVDGMEIVDTTIYFRQPRTKYWYEHDFQFKEIADKFPEHIEKKISKAQFEKGFDAEFFGQFPYSYNGITHSWDLGDGLKVYRVNIKKDKLSLYDNGNFVRDIIKDGHKTTSVFRNNNDELVAIHKTWRKNFVEVMSQIENKTTIYEGRNIADIDKEVELKLLNKK